MSKRCNLELHVFDRRGNCIFEGFVGLFLEAKHQTKKARETGLFANRLLAQAFNVMSIRMGKCSDYDLESGSLGIPYTFKVTDYADNGRVILAMTLQRNI